MAMRYYASFPGQNGEPFRAMAPHGLRIGHAERDAAAADLGDHYVAGRLSLDELHERLGAVFAAKTYGQLSRIMADLPRLRRPVSQAEPARQMQAAWAGAYWASSSAGFPPSIGERRQATPSDRAGRVAAVSLLILAMLIWLFTALIFARHGFYHQGPFGPH
jgi:Domain of unknown function (DUF1707)